MPTFKFSETALFNTRDVKKRVLRTPKKNLRLFARDITSSSETFKELLAKKRIDGRIVAGVVV